MNDFKCNCRDGVTIELSDNRVSHKCGFVPSRNYGEEGRTFFYRRVPINGTDRANWFREYITR